MHDLISDIVGFLKTLNQIDFLLYIAVLFLVILVVSLIYIIKNGDAEELEEKNNNEFNIQETLTNLEKISPEVIEYTPYEEEQEQKAIISYEELLAQNQKPDNLKEMVIPHEEISIKKIDLTKEPEVPNLPKKADSIEETQKIENNNNYQKEETYLNNLKSFLKSLE